MPAFEFEMLEQVLPKLTKYLKPAAPTDGDLDIWFVEPGKAIGTPVWPTERQP